MKNTYSIEFELIKEKGKEDIIRVVGECPACMSTDRLIGFIDCLQTINNICIEEANERIKNGTKNKSQKKKR